MRGARAGVDIASVVAAPRDARARRVGSGGRRRAAMDDDVARGAPGAALADAARAVRERRARRDDDYDDDDATATTTARPAATATDEDYARLDAYLSSGFGLVHDDGRDAEGRAVVTVNATRIPGWAGSADRDNAMNLIVKTLDRAATAGEYVVVVYFGDDDRTKGVVPTHSLNWLGDLHDKLEYQVRKNVKKIVFVNATWIMSAIISLTMTFATSKASKKFAWTKSLDDMDKDTGYHLNQVMCGEKFLASVGRKVVYAEPETADAAPAPEASS